MVTNHSEVAEHGLLQTPAEWARRNEALVQSLTRLVHANARVQKGRALDIGCMGGELTDMFASRTPFSWYGVDPGIKQRHASRQGVELLPGYAHQLPFPDKHFDCLIFANVYEHIDPDQRKPSLAEMNRVLVDGGTIVGQLPNPFFPIESHSRLPFMGWLPYHARRLYWRLSPAPWSFEEAHFFIVTVRHLQRTAEAAGFETVLIQDFNYPLEVIPRAVRWGARFNERLRLMPWAWQFVFRKRATGAV
jgi:SAM-dependent methyltransferase